MNQKKTHPIQKKYKDNPHREFLHAEIDAIIRAKKILGDLKGCYVYVARSRECEDGFEKAMAKSCGGCSQCAKDFGVKGIFYTTYDGYGYQECNE